jgi:hypothetical protein
MRRIGPGMGVVVCLLLAARTVSAAERVTRLQAVDTRKAVPPEMAGPEGRTRWDLTGAAPGQVFTRTLEVAGKDVVVRDAAEKGGGKSTLARSILVVDTAGGDAAARWIFPDRYPDELRPGSRERFVLEERDDGSVDRIAVDVETVGVGWVHLPSGPREVALQRALVIREPSGAGPRTETVVHRWIDRRAGIVAEISGPASPDGLTRLSATDASVAVEVLLGAADLKIYVDEFWLGNYAGINYGWDRGTGTAISSLTTPGYSNMGALLAASSWNFSGNTSGAEVASTTTPVNSSETCNYAQCGYSIPGISLERTDKNFNLPASLDKTNDASIREDRPGDVTIWIRAGAQHEGKTGTFGSGESRFCYYGTDLNGKVRTQVPLWRFPHQDAGGWYVQAGDTWSGAAFNCEQNIFNQLCGTSQFLDKLYIAGSNVDSHCSHTGKQYSEVVKGGVITLPSGHTFNSLVVRQVADFCVYLVNGCSYLFKADEVRTFVYLWQVPHLGSVVLLQSPQTVADGTSFTTVNMTGITFGLYPPRTITVAGSTESSVTLSWDPGLDTHRISGYKVYWDTDSGGSTPYAYNSASNPGQVTFTGTGATISGLAGGTTYYFTATSLSTYTDPSSSVVTTYESLVYPTQVYGDPGYVYPLEVQATTTSPSCTPSAEVTGLVESRLAAGGIHFCWNPDTTDAGACLVGYRLLVSGIAQSRGNFVPLQDTGTETCADVSPYPDGDPNFFLVVGRGTGGEGPRGN